MAQSNFIGSILAFLNKYSWFFLITLLTLPCIVLSLIYSQGFNWPDEIFHSMEFSYYIMTGRGHIAWEFTEQARTTLYPQILSLWLRLVYFFSDDPRVLFFVTRSLLGVIFLGSILSIGYYFLKHESVLTKSQFITKNLLFVLIFLFFPLNYYFGFRTLSESISTSLSIISIFWIQTRIENNNQRILFLSFLLGLTYGLRFQMALFLAVYCLLMVYKLWILKLNKAIFQFLTGLILGFFVYLVSDFLFFGIPFISSVNYFKFTILKDVGDQWGTSPFSFYFMQYYRYFNAFLLFLIPGIYSIFKKQYPIIFGVILFILIHSLIAHKELRFIFFTFSLILYWILVGIWTSYLFLKTNFSKISIPFLIFVIIGSIYQQSIVLTKKIQWNFLNDNLQLFLQGVKNGVNENSLVSIQDTFAWGAGYVYLGPKFNGDLFYFDMSKKSELEKLRILNENKIKNILIRKNQSEYYCKEFKYCKTLLDQGNYSWIRN